MPGEASRITTTHSPTCTGEAGADPQPQLPRTRDDATDGVVNSLQRVQSYERFILTNVELAGADVPGRVPGELSPMRCACGCVA